MTEPGGRAARWTAAALAAPVVAGVFAGATTWATRVDPLHPNGAGSTDNSTVTTPGPSPTTNGDPAIVALRRQLTAQQLAMTKLGNQIAAVRAKARALAKQNGASVSGATTTRYAATSGGGGSARSSGSSGSSSSINQAPKPAPAPTTHGGTGASGSG